MTEPKLLIKSEPIDFELAELLGEKPADFIVLCFDGIQFESFGTPYDTPKARTETQYLVNRLNETSKDSLWPKMFANWKSEICKQYNLQEATTAKDYRPVVSYKISRVVHGYSKHLHSAIGLFDKIGDKINRWSVGKYEIGPNWVKIGLKSGERIHMEGNTLSRLIVEAVMSALKTLHSSAPPRLRVKTP